ncbi:MAG: transcription termination/antitermination protein NusG [Proteobacteria bacterium]|nr:transcription termination/antitermination protein NusG [Pseudomonadota bacterium]
MIATQDEEEQELPPITRATSDESDGDDADTELSEEDQRLARLIDAKYRWYIVNVYAGLEDSVKLNLLDRIKRAKVDDSFKEIMVPKMLVEKVLKSGRKMVEKTSFPGYIFIQVDLTELAYSTVLNTPRVIGFLGNHKHPKPMTDKDVLHFLAPPKDDDDVQSEVIKSDIVFERNQAIKVTGGPFANFDGIVDEVKPDQMKLRVLVSILGRETPVELGYDQVEKIDS